MIRGNTTDIVDYALPNDSVSTHGVSHHAWAQFVLPLHIHIKTALQRVNHALVERPGKSFSSHFRVAGKSSLPLHKISQYNYYRATNFLT